MNELIVYFPLGNRIMFWSVCCLARFNIFHDFMKNKLQLQTRFSLIPLR